MSVEEELTELLAACDFMSDRLLEITAFGLLDTLEQKDYDQIKLSAIEVSNSLIDMKAAIRRLSENLNGPRRGTGELKAK